MVANAQITVKPYSGAETRSFRQFEHLFRGFIGVAAIPANQQSNFLQLHLRYAALRYFQTLPEATRNDLELSLTALRDHFANQDLRFQEMEEQGIEQSTHASMEKQLHELLDSKRRRIIRTNK